MTIKTMTMRAAALVAASALTPAWSADSLEQALTGGTVSLDLRLRYEHAKQNNAAEDADAFTVRPRLGYLTGTWQGLDAFLEYEGVYAVGGEADYNSGPPFLDATNDHTGFSTIADPTGDEVNRAWLRYRGLPATTLKVGRQRIILDNARFIGNVGWRNNEQTFDAVSLVNQSLDDVTLTYAYLWRQNFIFFNDNGLDVHLFNANWVAGEALEVSAYGYLIDFDDDQGQRAPGAPDHRVLGLRASGALGPFGYALEFADQAAYADSPDSVDGEYSLVELSLPGLPITPSVGYEVLGGNSNYAFQFPLATNYAYQGSADLFLTTPPDGLVDTYVSLATTAANVKFTAVYHDFGADNGDADYGSEIDLAAAFPVNERLTLLAKFADYDADEFALDTRRYWLQAEYAF